jgi:hypothetical protein
MYFGPPRLRFAQLLLAMIAVFGPAVSISAQESTERRISAMKAVHLEM